MAKVKFDIDALKRSVRDQIESSIKEDKFLQDIGDTVIKNSVAQSRLGNDPATLKKYADFSGANKEAYIKRRDSIAGDRGAGPNFRASKSNLTITGQLLKSFRAVVNNGKVFISAFGNHDKYYSGQKTVSNAELARWHSEGAGGYPARLAIGISDKVRKIINDKIRAQIRRSILGFKR